MAERRGAPSYQIVSENGAVEAFVHAGKGARSIARAMAAAGATVDSGVRYQVRVGYGKNPVYENEPILVYIAEPGEPAYGTPRKRQRK